MGNLSSFFGALTSLLPRDVQAILQRGMTEGFKHSGFGDGYLNLNAK